MNEQDRDHQQRRREFHLGAAVFSGLTAVTATAFSVPAFYHGANLLGAVCGGVALLNGVGAYDSLKRSRGR